MNFHDPFPQAAFDRLLTQACEFDLGIFSRQISVMNVRHGLIPFRANEYQQGLFTAMSAAPVVLAHSPRQWGKSTACCIFALWKAMFNPGSHIYFMSHRPLIGNFSLHRCDDLYSASAQQLPPAWTTLQDFSKHRALFSNGSMISFASEPMILRGHRNLTLIFDEFGWNNDEEFMAAACEAGQAEQRIFVSTDARVASVEQITMLPASTTWMDVEDKICELREGR